MSKMTVAQLAELVAQQSEQIAALIANSSSAAVPVTTTEGGETRTRKNRRGLATAEKRKTYLEYKIEVADRLSKEKGIHYSVFEIESGKLLLFSEITEHRNNQKGHKATEKWGPRLYNSKSGMTATGTAYIS